VIHPLYIPPQKALYSNYASVYATSFSKNSVFVDLFISTDLKIAVHPKKGSFRNGLVKDNG
jgi:hypothetical protein